MKKKFIKSLTLFMVSALLFLQAPINAQINGIELGYVGKVWKSEKKTWIDKDYGYEITKWTDDDVWDWHVYFNIESFVDDTTCIIFSERAGGVNLFKLNLNSGLMVQMTNYEGRIKHVWHLPDRNEFYFELGDNVHRINTKSFNDEQIFSFKGYQLKSFF